MSSNASSQFTASSSSQGSSSNSAFSSQSSQDVRAVPPLRIDDQRKDTDALMDSPWDSEAYKNVDPLAYYHQHMLESNPDLDASVASDDDLLTLLRTTPDRNKLKWIEECGLPLSAQPVPVTYPPWHGKIGQHNTSVLSFESPTNSAASMTSSVASSFFTNSSRTNSGDNYTSSTHGTQTDSSQCA
ncbi:hypothetical protein OC861_005119 [Tilletia horrida]|nr:hypothetical protein OC861_005119 [Tilletia horrida]